MIIKLMLCSIAIFVSAAFCFSQTALPEKWTRIDSQKNEVSASFPPGYLVDAIKRSDGQTYRIVGYTNGITMEMRVEDDINARDRIKRVSPNADDKAVEFTVKGIRARRMSSTTGNGQFSERVYVGAGSRFYYLAVKSSSIQKPELMRFLCSIRIGGNQIHECSAVATPTEEIVPIKSLVTSDAVREAYDRKSGREEINVVYEEESKFVSQPEVGGDVVPAVIIERPHPNMRSVLSGSVGPPKKKFTAKLKINFLANGLVGDIVAYSSNEDYARACVEAAKKIKFIPAKDGNKNINSVAVEDYSVETATFSSVMIIYGPVR